MKIKGGNFAIFIFGIFLLFTISTFIITTYDLKNNFYNEIVISSNERGNQVEKATGFFSLSSDPNSPTSLILGYNGTFGNASATWILDTYYARDIRDKTLLAEVYVRVNCIPRLPPANFQYKENASYSIYVNNNLVAQGKFIYQIPRHEAYGLVPINSSDIQVLVKDGIMEFRVPLTLLSDRTAVTLEIKNYAIWEVYQVGVMVKLNTIDVIPYWIKNLPIVILALFLVILSIGYFLIFIIQKFKEEKNKTIWHIFIIGFLIRICLAPFTQDTFDTPFFRNVISAWYTSGINPLSIWTYGTGWLATIICYGSIGFILTHLLWASTPPTPFLTLFIKVPIIMADLLIPLIIYFYRRNLNITDNVARFLALLWIFSPYTILVSSVWGQFDAIPTFFALASLIMLVKRKISVSAVLLSLGTLFKFFPLLLLPVLGVVLLKNEGIKKFIHFVLLFSLIVVPLQLGVYYIYAPQLLVNILGYRAGVGSWGEYYQGLTYLDLLWRLGVIKKLYPSSFIFLFILVSMMSFLLLYFKERDIFSLDPQNLLILTCLPLISFFLSYNMVNQQFILWILPPLMLLSYGYGRLPKRAFDFVHIIAITATSFYLFQLIVCISKPLFTSACFSFSILILIILLMLILKPKLQSGESSIPVFLEELILVISLSSAWLTIFIPAILFNQIALSLVLQSISVSTLIISLFTYFYLYLKNSPRSTSAPCQHKRTGLIFTSLYAFILLQIILIGTPAQAASIMRPIFGTSLYNWGTSLMHYSIWRVLPLEWMRFIAMPQISLSILSLISALAFPLKIRSLNIFSIATPLFIINYIIVYVFGSPHGYVIPHNSTLFLALITICLILSLFCVLVTKGNDP